MPATPEPVAVVGEQPVDSEADVSSDDVSDVAPQEMSEIVEDIAEGQEDDSEHSHEEVNVVDELDESQEETVNEESESLSEEAEIQSENSENESENSDAGSGDEDVQEMFHSAQSDVSLDTYDDVDPPPRRSTRNKRPSKKLVYEQLGQPDWKSLRIKGHSTKVKKKRK